MKARGNTAVILRKVGQIQDFVGQGIGYHMDDRNPNGYELGQAALQKAFALCLEITGMYDQLPQERKNK